MTIVDRHLPAAVAIVDARDTVSYDRPVAVERDSIGALSRRWLATKAQAAAIATGSRSSAAW
jgi:hypothetical protein